MKLFNFMQSAINKEKNLSHSKKVSLKKRNKSFFVNDNRSLSQRKKSIKNLLKRN